MNKKEIDIFEKFTDDELGEIISSIIGGNKFGALVAYKKLLKVDGEECIKGVLDLAKKVGEKKDDVSFIMKYTPKCCCKNCLGAACSAYKVAKKEGFFDKDHCRFFGSGCERFYSVDLFKKEIRKSLFKEAKTINDKVSLMQEIYIDGDIIKIVRYKFNRRNNSMIGKRNIKFYIIEDKFFDNMVKKARKNNPTREEFDGTLHVYEKKVKKGERYKDYVSRIMNEVKAKSKEVEDKVNGLTFEEALDYIKNNILTETAKKILDSQYNGNVNKFMIDFYPDYRNPFDVCLEHMKANA